MYLSATKLFTPWLPPPSSARPSPLPLLPPHHQSALFGIGVILDVQAALAPLVSDTAEDELDDDMSSAQGGVQVILPPPPFPPFSSVTAIPQSTEIAQDRTQAVQD